MLLGKDESVRTFFTLAQARPLHAVQKRQCFWRR